MNSRQKSERSGVALIMAVGFLAVLILLAVGFAVSMRVERLAARNYSDVVSARQYVRTGLTRAMTDLDGRLQTDPLLASSQGVWPGSGSGTNELISGWVTNYLPSHLVSRASLANAGWTNVYSEIGGRLVGRFQYVVVDCSGLIDVNFDHSTNKFLGSGPRTTVTNSLDLWLDSTLIPDVASGQFGTLKDGRVANVGALAAFTPWGRVESLAELSAYLGPAPGAGLFNNSPSNFFIYSRYPAGYEITPNSGNVTEALPVAVSQAEWDLASSGQKTATNLLVRIARQLELGYQQIPALSGQASELAFNLAYSLGDYCDSDDIPITYTNSCTEATPLLNEVLFECELVQTPADYTLNIYPRVEVVFPFGGVSNNTKSYTMVLSCQFSGATPAALNPSGPKQFRYTFTPSNGTWKWVSPAGAFQVSPPEGGPGAFTKLTTTAPATSTAGFGAFKCDINLALFEGIAPSTTKAVDGVGLPTALSIPLNFVTVNARKTGGKACNDPRHNAYSYEWTTVTEGATPGPTLAAFNTGVSTYNSGAGEGLRWMYIANRAMRSPGDIGLLGFSPQYPWRTVDIIDTPAGASPYWLPVLDLFSMITNQSPRFGLINLNSLQTNVIACAFNGVSPEAYPNASSDGNSSAPTQVLPAEALNIARAFTASRGANLARNVSGVRVLGLSSAWGAGWSLPDREAAVRNSVNVLGSRDSTYTIIVRAQALSEDGALPVGEQKALAVVWRDRVPSRDRAGNLYYPSFVRYFRWITD